MEQLISYNIHIVSAKTPTLARALQLSEGPRRTAAVVAWIQSLYASSPPVLVGGAAVELYTGGAYTTGDGMNSVVSALPHGPPARESANSWWPHSHCAFRKT